MSDAPRPSGRGRGSGRGGRGGHGGRGRGGHRAAADTADAGVANSGSDAAPEEPVEEGEIGALKAQYRSQLRMVQEMFPNWTSDDIVCALAETDGDLERTISRMTEGNASQWGEVKKKARIRSAKQPVKDGFGDSGAAFDGRQTSGSEGSRGRGRGDRVRGRGGRGGRSEQARDTDGSSGIDAAALAGWGEPEKPSFGSDPPRADSGWSDNMADAGESWSQAPAAADSWSQAPAESWAQASTEATSQVPTDSWSQAPAESWSQAPTDSWSQAPEESWSSGPAKPDKEAPPTSRPDGTKSWASIFAKPKPVPKPVGASKPPVLEPNDEAPASVASGTGIQGLPPPLNDDLSQMPNTPPNVETVASIAPSKDNLTETNLEKVPDISAPATTATAASTAASTVDQRVLSGAGILGGASAASRPPLGGYATSALKATSAAGRSSSFQRRIAEQQEAVVMPGKHAVDKAAVQFGSMGLNGPPQEEGESDREDPETRVQPPPISPGAPRASLPPSQPDGAFHDGGRQPPASYPYSQFQEQPGPPHQETGRNSSPKPFHAFGHANDPYASEATPDQRQYLAGKYSSYYGNEEQQRNAYPTGQYNGFGQQQPTHGEQEGNSGPQRIGSTNASQYSSRYAQTADSAHSGQSTPYGSIGAHQSGPQQGHMAPGAGPSQHGSYGYGSYPYGGYYSSYNMSQYGYGGQNSYSNGPFGGAKAPYGQSQQQHGYGMSPQLSHEQHSASPANAGPYAHQGYGGRDLNAGSNANGVGGFGARSGSTQPTDGVPSAGSAGASDPYQRAASHYHHGNDDSYRGYHDSSKGHSGMSPAIPPSGVAAGGVGPTSTGRPSSTANNPAHSGLPPQDARLSQQQSYGGFPATASGYGQGQNPGSQGHQPTSAYGSYGGGYGGASYYGNSNSRGAWANYGH